MMLLSVATALALDPVIEELADAKVDWTSLRLLATSAGVPSSGVLVNLETLEGDARQRLGPRMLKMARDVRISASSTTGDLLDAKDAVSDRVDANLQHWEVYEVRYYTSGGVEMEAAMSLQELLRPALVTMAQGKDRSAPPSIGTTGLVVDARGLDVTPAIAPRLLDAAGATLYGAASMTPMAASLRSPVVYVSDPADIAAARRGGSQPMFVRAVAVEDDVDIVIDAADVALLTKAASEAPFLLQGNVVVVVGP